MLVESLLDFGRREGRVSVYQFEPLDCGELVRRAGEEFKNEAQPGGFLLSVTAADSGKIEAHGEAIGRALSDLLHNAVKYSSEERKIDMGIQPRQRRDQNRHAGPRSGDS